MSRDFFAHKADIYEQNKNRVDNVDNIAKAVIASTPLNRDMHIIDFGSGTGLLLERVAPYVRKITAVDISRSMNEQLYSKRERIACALDICEVDLEADELDGKYDGIISSMTMHHIKDIKSMFYKFHSMLNDGGFIAISDLDSEDGSFHTEDTGVYHCGFGRSEISEIARSVGFKEISILDASVIRKPQGDFSVFLLKAVR